MKLIQLLSICLVVGACNSNKYLETVDSVDLDSYAGIWYEIARLPNSFEKNLKCVTANYTLLESGNVEVLNRGYNTKKEKWEDANGKAKVASDSFNSRLKVSFFGPFYGDYYIIELDPQYRFALVGSPSREYLWILSRTPVLDKPTIDMLLEKAKKEGFKTSDLSFTEQDCTDSPVEKNSSN
ncbi:hypothetical protein GYB22_04890 [bacterium]|nr:hypothetical protein [bacterium]